MTAGLSSLAGDIKNIFLGRRGCMISVSLLAGVVILCLVSAVYLLSPCQFFMTRINQLPRAQPLVFNIAVVISGDADDSGWSGSHANGWKALTAIPGVNAVLVENIPEFCDTQHIFESLAERGFQLVFGTDYGYMDAIQVAAQRNPQTTFVHLLGSKRNDTNFDNLNGAMEEMMYLSGMLAGARAWQDQKLSVGYIATFPIPEQFRWANAAARGMRLTCPNCMMKVAWLNSWNDRGREKALARELYQDGAYIVITATDSGDASLEAAAEKTTWAIITGQPENCTVKECIGAAYWDWGPVYTAITRQVQDRSFRPQSIYFHTDSGGLGLYGLMPGDPLLAGWEGVPVEVINQIRAQLTRFQQGLQEAQLEIFRGPINDNMGREIVPAGEFLDRKETDQFPPGAPGQKCRYCICWWVEGIESDLPEICKNSN